MNKQATISLILLGVLCVTCLLIWRGRKVGRPPGQRGLAGTTLAGSEALRLVQLGLLALLAAACAAGLAWLNL